MATNLTASIITIGDEILIGQIVNTNAAFLGNFLTESGYTVSNNLTVGDNEEQIKLAIINELEQNDVVITTGGLGPTHDDITKKIILEIFGGKYVRSDEQFEVIREIFEKRGRTVSALNEQQADVPDSGKTLVNNVGTAPGMWFSKNGHDLFVLPGVPKEMKFLALNRIKPIIEKKNPDQKIVQRTLRTHGIPESTLAEKIGDVKTFLPENSTLAFLPSLTGVRLRVLIKGTDLNRINDELEKTCQLIIVRSGIYYYGEGEEEIENALVSILKSKSMTLSVAESCTGGLIGDKLTNISGVSEILLADVVSYSNDSKIKLLGVNPESIKKFGAVSEQVAVEMAEGIRKTTGSSIGISTTGIAGPTGGSEEKPVGLVYIGFSDGVKSFAKKINFPGDRVTIKERTANAAFSIIRNELLGIS